MYAANILRDKKGINEKEIGIGNEKAMCQMISHHAVIFKPEQLKVWVSTSPYQLGKFVCYDLNEIFNSNTIHNDSNFTIAEDPFLSSKNFTDYTVYKDLYKAFDEVVKEKKIIANYDDLFYDLVRLNTNYYKSYILAADYLIENKDTVNAIKYLEMALTLEFENTPTKELAEKKLKELK